MRRRIVEFGLILLVIVTLIGCGGDGDDTTGNAQGEYVHLKDEEITTQVTVALVPSEFVLGPNRFAIGLMNAQGELIHDAKVVHLAYYDLRDPDKAVYESEAYATRVKYDEGPTTIYVHERDFDLAGLWGVEVEVRLADGGAARQRVGFEVMGESKSLGPGEKAAPIHTLVLDDVNQDLSRLTSSPDPNPALHKTRLDDAVSNGKPTVLLFATPAYCQTRFCGPAYEVTGELERDFGQQVNFVYVEVFSGLPDPATTNWQPTEAASAFGIESEPWIYLIDADGTIVYRLEGLFTTDEVERQLKDRLGL